MKCKLALVSLVSLVLALAAGTALAQSTNVNTNLDTVYGQWLFQLSNTVTSGAKTLVPVQCYASSGRLGGGQQFTQ
jgi:hypothetical protein